MFIVFEGIDGCGKTTLAKMLSEKMNIPYYKCFLGGGWEHLFKISKIEGIGGGYEDLVIVDLIDRTGYNLILDRSYPSAVVYGYIEERNLWPEKSPSMTENWINRFNDATGIMIWVRANAYECHKRNNEKSVSELARLEEEYYWFFELHGKSFNHYLEMYNEIPIELTFQSICEWLERGAK